MADAGVIPRVAAREKLWLVAPSMSEVRVPCIPSMLESYIELCASFARTLHRPFDEAQAKEMRERLGKALAFGAERSPDAVLCVRFEANHKSPTLVFEFEVKADDSNTHYAEWAATRPPPLFGAFPDAFVFDEVSVLIGDPPPRVLDVGAGNGRNAIPLAALGVQIDALERSPDLGNQLRFDLDLAKPFYDTTLALDVHILDFFDAPFAENTFDLVYIAQVLSSHIKDEADLARWLAKAAALAKPGGRVVWNAFVLADDVRLDAFTEEFARAKWTVPFYESAIRGAAQASALTIDRREDAHDFEEKRAMLGAWPPTGWFPFWSRGLDVFKCAPEASPLRLVWFAATKGP